MPSSTSNTQVACDRCGTLVAHEAKFCSACGFGMGQGPPREPDSVEPDSAVLLESLRQATIGEYDIHRELGRGGMATVYLAHDLALDRQVAIKVMSPALRDQPGNAERFKREARTAAKLSHPNIIPIYTVKQSGEVLYFVMKYVEGRALDLIVAEQGPLPVSVVHTVLRQVASALAYAHAKGVVHRDVKPANIILDEEGWAIVTDFGIAKVAEAQGLTMTGSTVGTPTYMSPEQCVGGEVTGASDQYSLGLVAYQLLTGALPFTADTVMSAMWAHVNEPPKEVWETRPDCPMGIGTAMMRMLEKEPPRRWPDLAAAVRSLGPMSPEAERESHSMLIGLATSQSAPETLPFITPRSPVPPGKPGTTAPEPKVRFVTVMPPAGTLRVGESLQLAALPKDESGRQLTGRAITWSSSASGIATVDPQGVVRGQAAGSVTISASCEGATDISSIEVTPLPVHRVDITPLDGPLQVGSKVQLAAEVIDVSGERVSDRLVKWLSSDPSIASVSASGVVAAIRPGPVSISTMCDGKRASTNLVVKQVAVHRLVISPEDPVVGVNENVQLHGTPVDTDSRPLARRTGSWVSSNEQIATVSPSGVVTGHTVGTVEITAVCEGCTGTVSVTVKPVPLAQIRVSPRGGTMVAGERIQLIAEPVDVRGNVLTDRETAWSSNQPSIVSISQDGVVTAAAMGTASLTAACDGKESTIEVVVTRVGVAKIKLSTPTRSLEVGGEAHARATTFDRFGERLTRRFLRWMSSNPAVATVSRDGVIVGVARGTAEITASCGGARGTVRIDVVPPSVASIRIEPSQVQIPMGGSQRLQVVAHDIRGGVVPDLEADWASSDPSTASVSPDGVVTALRDGSVMVAASAHGKRATARVLVSLMRL